VTTCALKRGPSHHGMSFGIHFCSSSWSSYLYVSMYPRHGTNASAWPYEDDAEAFNAWRAHHSQDFQPISGLPLFNGFQAANRTEFQPYYLGHTMASPGPPTVCIAFSPPSPCVDFYLQFHEPGHIRYMTQEPFSAFTQSSSFSDQPDFPTSEPSPPPKRLFQCPIYQANRINGQPFSCKGVKAENMAAVRRHIKRSHIPSQVSFIKLCTACNEDIIDEEKFEHEHGNSGEFCDSHQQQQRRGKAAEEQWNALFRKLNLSSTEFASPCKYLFQKALPLLIIAL
jgi:hypothetical protein